MKLSASVLPMGLVVLASCSLVFLVLYCSMLGVFYSSSTFSQIPSDLQMKNKEILSYLSSPLFSNPVLDLPPSELSHMQDVRFLMTLSFVTAMLSFGVLVGLSISFYKMKVAREELLSRTFWLSGWIILVAGGLVGLAALLSFDRFWMLFHVFFFPQGGWYFPSDSLLIQLYPQSFWSNAVFKWAYQVLIAGILLTCLGWLFQTTRYHHILFEQRKKR